jgi:DNA polymerase III epsilon subunit-like protein
MAKHLMVDLETMATTPDAAILTIGAVTFNPNGFEIYDEFYAKVDIDSIMELGAHIDEGTLKWWAEQSEDVREEAFSEDGREHIKTIMDNFYKFCMGSSKFWSHGSSFDIVILEHYFRKVNKSPPWNFWEVRDTRTLFDLGFDPEMPQADKHHALADARRQAMGVQTMFKKLNRKF